MNNINVLLDNLETTILQLGRVGENEHTQIRINCISIFSDYPNATVAMTVQPPQGEAYPKVITRSGVMVSWVVLDSDLVADGSGQIQLTFTNEDEIIKTVIGNTQILPSLEPTGDVPTPIENWIDTANEIVAEFQSDITDIQRITTAEASDEGKVLSAKTVTDGKVTEWQYVDVADPDVITQAVDDWLDDHPEATTTVEDGAITEPKLNDSLKSALAWQSDVDGLMSAITRPEFIVGNAEEVLSDRGETDEAVYLFRKTGGTKKAYNREQVKRLVGGTVAWNQLMTGMTTTTNDGITTKYYSDTNEIGIKNDSRTTNYGTGSTRGPLTANFIVGHKYILIPSKSITGVVFVRGNSANELQNIFEMQADYEPRMRVTSAYDFVSVHPVGDETKFKLSIIDLTAALGSTIADYLYTLETQTPGAGVALFRSLFDKSYYAYNSGSLESVNVSEHRLTGFNQWDEVWENGDLNTNNGANYPDSAKVRSKNYIPLIPSETYYYKCSQNAVRCYYDENKTYIPGNNSLTANSTFTVPDNAHYMRFAVNSGYGTTYKNDICINISDAAKNGQYEPYQLYTYSMPNVMLRGIPKLVSNEIVFDGDELLSDGTVKRNYTEVTFNGTEEWSAYRASLTSEYYSYWIGNMGDFVPQWSSENVASMISTGYPMSGGNVYNRTGEGYATDATKAFFLCVKGITTVEAFKTWLQSNPVTFLCKVNTPTTESADPYQELQVCNRYGTEEYIDRLATAETSPRDVAIPCGHQTFYPVNVFDYIDELTKPDNNFIADANIQSGKYFSVGNGLYLSTQAIAQGETITPGTNCTAVSLADALNAINQ